MRVTSLLGLTVVTFVAVVACEDRKEDATVGAAPPGDESPAAGGPTDALRPSRAALATVPPEQVAPERERTPAVRFVGRFDERDPGGPKAGWPGSRIIARWSGTSVSVRLGEEPTEAGPSEWDVAIDGKWSTARLVLTPGAQVYSLANSLPAGAHTVELYRRSEGQTGLTQFLGFDFHGGTLLTPPLRKLRKLEIIGDSDVSGFGYEGAFGADCSSALIWSARFQNFRGAWGERLAQKLDAELNATVFSGKGFYYNIWRPDLETIGTIYPRSNPLDPTSTFDLTKFVADVEVVSLGGNDFNMGLPEDFGAPPLEGFTQKVRELTGMLRKSYPQMHIFLMAYAVLTDEYPPGRLRRTNVETALKTVMNEHNAAGDARVYFLAPPPSVPSELTGCDGHGGPEYHERIATFMASQIAAKLGW